MPPTVTAVIAVLVWVAFRWMGAVEYAWFAGTVGGYIWYDLTHYYLHHAAPTTAAGKWLRKYHLVHHFQTPDRRYGNHHARSGISCSRRILATGTRACRMTKHGSKPGLESPRPCTSATPSTERSS